MKKFTSFLTMAFLAMLSLSLTSCDEDANIAYTLDGSWEGDMYVMYGRHQAMYSEITFDAGWDSGDGYWVDYYDGNYWGGRNYVANHIHWSVRNGNIYIHFIEEDSNVVIYDYSLGDHYFSGYIEAENGNRARFRLTRTSGYGDWDDYYWGYGWSKTPGVTAQGTMSRAASVDGDSMAEDTERPVRRFVVDGQ